MAQGTHRVQVAVTVDVNGEAKSFQRALAQEGDEPLLTTLHRAAVDIDSQIYEAADSLQTQSQALRRQTAPSTHPLKARQPATDHAGHLG